MELKNNILKELRGILINYKNSLVNQKAVANTLVNYVRLEGEETATDLIINTLTELDSKYSVGSETEHSASKK